MSDQPPPPPWEPPSQPWQPPAEQPGQPHDPWRNPYGTPWSSPQERRVDRGPYAAYVLPPPSKRLAGWALGLGVAPCMVTWPIGAIMAIVVLVRCRDGRDHGKGLAIGALAAAVGWTMLTILATAAGSLSDESSHPDRVGHGPFADAGDQSIVDLRVGDCFQIPAELQLITVDSVSCDEPHDAEVYAVVTMDLDEYPGMDELLHRAQRRCLAEFEPFIGKPYRQSVLDILTIAPNEKTWIFDEHEATCSVYEPVREGAEEEKRLVGTLRHAAR